MNFVLRVIAVLNILIFLAELKKARTSVLDRQGLFYFKDLLLIVQRSGIIALLNANGSKAT
jgi:hypothetical protein